MVLDIGGLYEVDLERLSQLVFGSERPRGLGTSLTLGAAVQNLGVALDAFIDTKERMPLTFRWGLGYRPFGNRMTLDLAGVKAIDDAIRLQAGLEYWIKEALSLRAGYNGALSQVKNGSSLDDLSGLACGLGVRYRGYSVGAAYTPFAGLGHPLRFELGAEF